MRRYQAVLILNPDLEEKPMEDFREGFRKLLKKAKAKNIEEIENEVRDLAHIIKKQPRAHFWRVAFDVDPKEIAMLKDEIRHDERLLRQSYLALPASGKEENAKEE